MDLTATVIICTRNRCNDLIECLVSIMHQTMAPHELIIVDSSDVPLSRESRFASLFTANSFPLTRLEYLHTQPGLTYQRNQGIKKAHGKIIYFFDDDVILSTTYIAQMQHIFNCYPHYAAGMGDISNSSKRGSRYYRWFRQFFLLPHEQGSGYFTWSGMPTHPYGTPYLKQVEVLGGCCMAFRATLFTEFLFDETMRGYCYLEDADIARRISLRRSLFFNPAAQLEHRESPAARHRRVDIQAMFIYNYSYLFFKNFYPYNQLKIIAYWWSLLGLLLQGILVRDRDQIEGFYKGLLLFYKQKRNYS